MKYPIQWLFAECPEGGTIPYRNYSTYNQAAWDFLELAADYRHFEAAFTYASRGLIKLTLDDATIKPVHNLTDESQYESYNRLVKPSLSSPSVDFGEPDLNELIEAVSRTLSVKGDRFTY